MRQLNEDEAPPDRESYPFDLCTPQRWWRLDKGIDFTGGTATVQMAAYKFAQRRGWSVRTNRNETAGWIDVMFLEPATTDEMQVSV